MGALLGKFGAVQRREGKNVLCVDGKREQGRGSLALQSGAKHPSGPQDGIPSSLLWDIIPGTAPFFPPLHYKIIPLYFSFPSEYKLATIFPSLRKINPDLSLLVCVVVCVCSVMSDSLGPHGP